MINYTNKIKNKVNEDRIKITFLKGWIRRIYIGFYEFLKDANISEELIYRHLCKLEKILLNADQELNRVSDINYDWVINELEKNRPLRGLNKSLLIFLENNKLISCPTKDDKILESIYGMIERFPSIYQRLIKAFINERVNQRARQIDNMAKKPLSLLTIQSNITIYLRFILWIQESEDEILHWDFIRENHINQFLINLPMRSREVARKDIYMLFRLAKIKKIIINIPMSDIKSREYESSFEEINFHKQQEIAQLITDSIYSDPTSSLISNLCFYHALSSKEIRNIKMEDIDIDKMEISISNRVPIYLMKQDLLILQSYLDIRGTFKNNKIKDYLILSKDKSEIYSNNPVSKQTITIKVKTITGYTPKELRISCLRSYASNYGPHFLVDAFGISLTQASRYAKFEEYLVEEEIKSQKMELEEMIRRNSETD